MYLLAARLHAQQITGVTKDKTTNRILSGVSISNTRTNDLYYSDARGIFVIYSLPNDTLKFTLTGYLDYEYVVSGKKIDIGIIA